MAGETAGGVPAAAPGGSRWATTCWTPCWSGPRTQAGGLRLTGEGALLGELVKAVLERALAAELTAPWL
jgi:hypothetical protein